MASCSDRNIRRWAAINSPTSVSIIIYRQTACHNIRSRTTTHEYHLIQVSNSEPHHQLRHNPGIWLDVKLKHRLSYSSPWHFWELCSLLRSDWMEMFNLLSYRKGSSGWAVPVPSRSMRALLARTKVRRNVTVTWHLLSGGSKTTSIFIMEYQLQVDTGDMGVLEAPRSST